jgi:hypothetical protein
MIVETGGDASWWDYFCIVSSANNSPQGANPSDGNNNAKDHGQARQLSDQLTGKLGACTGWWSGDEMGILSAFL